MCTHWVIYRIAFDVVCCAADSVLFRYKIWAGTVFIRKHKGQHYKIHENIVRNLMQYNYN